MNQRQYTTSVQDLLRNLEKVFTNQGGASSSGPYSKENVIPRIDSIVFKQGGEWIGQQKSLSPLEELELVDELGMYLQEQKHEYVRYRIFDAIFSMARDGALEYRRDVLCKLVSLAIASKSAATLECAALWMKSCEKEHVFHLISAIIMDYCILQTSGSSDLKACLETSPRFCCVFMVAVTTNYTMSKENTTDTKETSSIRSTWPCLALLDVVQHWLLKDPSLCYCTATQMDKLWRTVIKATQTLPDNLSLTPLHGLASWCVKTPFAPKSVTSLSQTTGRSATDEMSYEQLHSRLQYGFLKSLQASKPALKAIAKGSVLGNPDLQLWNKNQVHSLIGDLMAVCDHSDAAPPEGSADDLAVNRFSQICQIAIATRILTCTRDQFQSLSDPLPKTRLLEIIAYGPDRTPPSGDTPMEIVTY